MLKQADVKPLATKPGFKDISEESIAIGLEAK
jgi:hypothetical protein